MVGTPANHTGPKETPGNTVGYFNTAANVIAYSVYTGLSGFVLTGKQGSTPGAAGALLVDLTMPGWDLGLYLPWFGWYGQGSLHMPSGNGKNPWGSTLYQVYRPDISTFGLSSVNSLNSLRELVSGLVLVNSMAVVGLSARRLRPRHLARRNLLGHLRGRRDF